MIEANYKVGQTEIHVIFRTEKGKKIFEKYTNLEPIC